MRLFIRTEASTQIGLGHFMRCFAIAEEARAQGIEVTFLLNELGEAVMARLEEIGAKGVRIDGSLGSAADFMGMAALDLTRKDWLLIDGYAATEDYIALQSQAVRVAVVDDLNVLERFDCDLLINPAQAAKPADYKRKTRARLRLGPDYALIRKEFTQACPVSAEAPFVTIMFGGSDPSQLTSLCIEGIYRNIESVHVRTIAGPANVHTNDLTKLEQKLERYRLYASPPSVARVLAGSALVITAAGGSVGEVAAMGLPALVLVVYDNQAAALKACPYPVIDARAGLPDDLGAQVKALLDDPARLAEIARNAHAVVDGEGPRRIVEALRHV
ncbi:UDP-N-acetylglucosamine--N-acetylmuramyl-(pentapeptide) pyrophosphoryl-undecaprenol N-acetylglucosamine transferase [Asticcacaulis sp. MM231]|uniref:UDP-2,4-diacetamido-2,4, 6-trideoxy-beta-L-altropyranose hydrolase n=1 Tax=Asticcacaulis sp. MM231 TaxID=3157666 RepID=UPI0032D56EFC